MAKHINHEAPDMFKCPQCGGSHFGTGRVTEGWDVAVGYCHDQYGIGCKFKWNRRDDDTVMVERQYG